LMSIVLAEVYAQSEERDHKLLRTIHLNLTRTIFFKWQLDQLFQVGAVRHLKDLRLLIQI